MAKSAVELERELELKRTELHARVEGLRHRTAGDVQGMQHEAHEELASYVNKAESQVNRHMLLVLAGSLGTGIALGARRGARFRKAQVEHPPAGPRTTPLVLRGASTFAGLAGGQVKHEMREALHNAARAMLSRAVTHRARQAPPDKREAA